MAQRDPLGLAWKSIAESLFGHEAPTSNERVAPAMSDAERELVAQLRAGDVAAFSGIVERYHRLLLHLCRAFVSSPSAAEDVVQETWMAVIDGLDRFEGRSSLRTWICSIAVNRARVRRLKDGRTMLVPPLSFESAEEAEPEARVDFDKTSSPRCDERTPEVLLAGAEATLALVRAIDDLPPGMRAVVVLRDVEGLTSAETCRILDITDSNQRVLLHRGRAKLRDALAAFMGDQ